MFYCYDGILDQTNLIYFLVSAFGQARTRGQCVESSEWLYETLKRAAPNSAGLLAFETLSEICYDSNGELIRDKVKAMIKVFRPDRKGYLNKLEFVSSIDNVYRDLRVFRASLANSSSIDDAYETIINTVYYILIIFLGLIILGESCHIVSFNCIVILFVSHQVVILQQVSSFGSPSCLSRLSSFHSHSCLVQHRPNTLRVFC